MAAFLAAQSADPFIPPPSDKIKNHLQPLFSHPISSHTLHNNASPRPIPSHPFPLTSLYDIPRRFLLNPPNARTEFSVQYGVFQHRCSRLDKITPTIPRIVFMCHPILSKLSRARLESFRKLDRDRSAWLKLDIAMAGSNLGISSPFPFQ